MTAFSSSISTDAKLRSTAAAKSILPSDVCTHAYALLSDGWLDGYEIECPLHGARFDVRTGAALTSPAETALATYPVRVAGDAVKSMSPRHRLIPTRQPNLTARGATMSPFYCDAPHLVRNSRSALLQEK